MMKRTGPKPKQVKRKEGHLKGTVATLWQVMAHTGHGYKRHSLRNTGRGTDRRNDKLREIHVERLDEGSDEPRLVVEHVAYLPAENKLQRRARLYTIGVRA